MATRGQATMWSRVLFTVLSLGAVPGLGCGNPESTQAGGAGGATTSGGSGGTTTGNPGGGPQGGSMSTGGQGGAGNTSNVGGGVGGGLQGPEAEAVCSAVCGLGTCTGNLCTFGDFFTVGLTENRTQFPGVPVTAMARASACLTSGGTQQIDVFAIDGDCALIHGTTVDISEGLLFDAGSIQLEGATAGTIVLPPAGGQDCQQDTLPEDGAFSPGESITVDIAGGADIPAWTDVVTAPGATVLTVPPIKPGEPLVISWTPAPPPTWLSVVAPSNDLTLFCTPQLPGQITISAALTAQLGNGSGDALVFATRIAETTTDFGGAGPQASLAAVDQVTVFVPFGP